MDERTRRVWVAHTPDSSPPAVPAAIFDTQSAEWLIQAYRESGWTVLGPYELTGTDPLDTI